MSKGFTLIEIVMSVALLAILFVMVTPLQFITLSSTRVDRDITTSVDMLRRARSMARSGAMPWSVSFGTDDVVMWRGDLFAERDSSYDESATLLGTTAEDPVTVTFQSYSGLPIAGEQILLVEPTTNIQHPLDINIYGVITY